MPQSPQDILAASITVLLVAGTLMVLWFVLVRPGIKARSQVEALSQSIGLTAVSPAAFDQEFCMGGVGFAVGIACAAGKYHGRRAGILLQPARSKYVGQYTLAIVTGPLARESALSLQRGQAGFSRGSPTFKGTMAGTFAAYGPPSELDRVFNPSIQAQLCNFARQLLGVYCNKSFTWLTWEGIEDDPTVCDQALRLATEIAQIR